jgi:hypothetical protein
MLKSVSLITAALLVFGLSAGSMAADLPTSAAPMAADAPASDAPAKTTHKHKSSHKSKKSKKTASSTK